MIDTAKALTLAGIEMQWRVLSFCNFIQAARNQMVRDFLASDYTDLVFIDDDMGWSVDGLLKMLSADMEAIGAICPRRKDTREWNVNLLRDADGKRIERDGFIEASYVGTALLRIRASAFERMERAFDAGYEAGGFIGEDAWFCREFRRLGGRIWAYPDITVTHTGLKTWSGNYRRDDNAL